MITIICDICKQEIKNQDFMFDATVKELKDLLEVGNGGLNTQKKLDVKNIQICKECYYKRINSLII